MIPYPLGITRKKFKKIKIGVGLFPTYYGEGKGQPFARGHPLYCPALHCIKETENRHQNKRKTTKLKLIAATLAAHFNPSLITLPFLPTWVSRENRFLQLPGSVPLYLLHI